MRLRDDYTKDAAGGVKRWNKVIEKAGVAFELTLPHVAFHRQIGEFANFETDPDGNVVPNSDWESRKGDWIPDTSDGDFIQSLMKPQWESGAYADWIAPPKVGIDNKPGDFEYVQIHNA
jgi:benzoyl-CoA 2,3-dioxygenase component B